MTGDYRTRLHADTLYLSNIAHFLMDKKDYYARPQNPVDVLNKFNDGITQLSTPNTIIIEASIFKGLGNRPSFSEALPEDSHVEFQTRIHFRPERMNRVLGTLIKNRSADQPAI